MSFGGFPNGILVTFAVVDLFGLLIDQIWRQTQGGTWKGPQTGRLLWHAPMCRLASLSPLGCPLGHI